MNLLQWKNTNFSQLSVIINKQPNKRKQSMMDQEYILGKNAMPNVKQAVHLGIIRTNTLADNMTVNVEENIKKSRRSVMVYLEEDSMATMD